MPTATLEQRSAILARFGGIAIKREELMELGRNKGREFIQPHKLIYVYHDLIDMIGDKQGSETKTFQAVKNAIRELLEVVNFIVKSLNGSTVFLTADHGFLYQESAMSEADRSKLEAEPAGAIKAKKRYLLGRGLGASPKAWAGNTMVTAGTGADADSIDFWVPKGAARFHFAGGARFVHGSAMPQEIVVPVIAVKESESEKAKIKAVEVSLLGSSNKVVTNKQRFELIQNEAVPERSSILVSINTVVESKFRPSISPLNFFMPVTRSIDLCICKTPKNGMNALEPVAIPSHRGKKRLSDAFQAFPQPDELHSEQIARPAPHQLIPCVLKLLPK